MSNLLYQNGIFFKKFQILSFGDSDWLDRIEKQKYLQEYSNNFPQINYQLNESDNSLIQQIPKVRKFNFGKERVNFKIRFFDEFCLAVNYMHELNHVHGDILMKNVIFNGKELVLIDFEPSLKIKNTSNKEVLKVTYPWIHIDDLKLGNITTKTDVLCLHALELYIFDKYEYYNFRENQMKKLQMQNLASQSNRNFHPIIPNLNY